MATNWYIVGNGSIGGLLIHGFYQSKMPLSIISRKVETYSFSVTDINQNQYQHQLHTIEQPAERIDFLLLPLKAYQISEACEQLKNAISKSTVLILLHNGMGTLEQVKQLFPSNPILLATTTHGAFKPDKHSLIHTGLGETRIGLAQGTLTSTQTTEITMAMSLVLSPFEWLDNIQLALWNKLIVNCAINPLTAIEQCKNGQLAKPQFRQKLESITKETVAVATAMGFPIDYQQQLGNVEQVIKATAENYSSMNRDIQKQQRSEIDFINGYIVEKAGQLGIDVPANQQLYFQIKALEKRFTDDTP